LRKKLFVFIYCTEQLNLKNISYWHYFTTKIMSICPIWNFTLYVTQNLHFFENHPNVLFLWVWVAPLISSFFSSNFQLKISRTLDEGSHIGCQNTIPNYHVCFDVLYQVRVITVFTVFRLLTDFVCLYNYEFWLSLCKIVRSSVILLLPLFDGSIYKTCRYLDIQIDQIHGYICRNQC
jgi:hypothetical protein